MIKVDVLEGNLKTVIKDAVETNVKGIKEKTTDNKVISEFNDKAGEIFGRTKVLLGGAKEISYKELAELKEILRKKMVARGFSQNNINYILSYTDKYNYRVTQAFVNDEYAHTSVICWAVPYTTKETAHLMEDAVKKRNYEAVYKIKSGTITNTSQIKDMNEEVIANGRPYNPIRKNTLAIDPNKYREERNDVLGRFKANGIDLEAIRYAYGVNEETMEVAKAILDDPAINKDKQFILWVLPYSNSENAEYMLRAILNKDYQAVYSIHNGDIRLFDTLDARYAANKRLKALPEKERSNVYFGPYLNDEVSPATKILFEDSFYDNDFILKVAPKINKKNVREFKEALLNHDIGKIEKLCGEKLRENGLSGDLGEIKIEIEKPKSKSNNGRISRGDFIDYIDSKITHAKDFKTDTLSDVEVRNLMKLLGTSEDQIMNMDKKEYRRLCLKFHPDKNQDDQYATNVFRILTNIFLGQ